MIQQIIGHPTKLLYQKWRKDEGLVTILSKEPGKFERQHLLEREVNTLSNKWKRESKREQNACRKLRGKFSKVEKENLIYDKA